MSNKINSSTNALLDNDRNFLNDLKQREDNNKEITSKIRELKEDIKEKN
jgi:hypothetical protein